MNIGCLSETQQDYSEKLKSVKTFDELIRRLDEFKPIAFDAYNAVNSSVTSETFEGFMKRLKRTRFAKSEEDYDEVCGVVLMPETMFKVSLVSEQFKVPFGTAFIRLKEFGKIIEVNGHYEINELK